MRRGFLNTPSPAPSPQRTPITIPPENIPQCPICLETILTVTSNSTVSFIKCSNNHYSHKECIANTFKQECPVCRVSIEVDAQTSSRINRNARNINAEWDREYENDLRNTYGNIMGGLTEEISQMLVRDTRARILREFNDIARHIPLEKVKEILIGKINNGWSESQLRNLLATDHYQHLTQNLPNH